MKILGLDLSLTASGWAIYDGDSHMSGVITSKLKDPDRMLDIEEQIDCLLSSYAIEQVIIEDFAYGARGKGLFQIAGLGWLIRCLLARNKQTYILVSPSELKKFVTGKGNAPKDIMMLKCYKKFGIEFGDNNECDAYCLARYGWGKENETKK